MHYTVRITLFTRVHRPINNSFPLNSRAVISTAADDDGRVVILRGGERRGRGLILMGKPGHTESRRPTRRAYDVIHVYLRDIYLIYRRYKPEPIFISEPVHFWFPYSCNRSSLRPLKMLNAVTFNE